MTEQELLELISAPEFNLLDHAILETDTPAQAEEKTAFLQSIADLGTTDEGGGDRPEPITCMVNCVLQYLQCKRDNPSIFPDICYIGLQSCINNCGGAS